jgi:hypothetical protein
VIKYSGGNTNDASSFTCVEQNPILVQEDLTLPEPRTVIEPPKPIPLSGRTPLGNIPARKSGSRGRETLLRAPLHRNRHR